MAAALACAACGGPADDRSVLFAECQKDKQHTSAGCQCVVDAQFKHFDKDVLRVFVLRAQDRHGEADALMESIPADRSAEQMVNFAFGATGCEKAGAS
jgi:hypothetical protein